MCVWAALHGTALKQGKTHCTGSPPPTQFKIKALAVTALCRHPLVPSPLWSHPLNTDLSHLQFLVIDALEDVKAQDIQVFDTTAITTLFDRVVMASGTSNRQTRALAKSVHDKVREAGAQVLSIEGTDTGELVLVDLGDVVVHIMQPVTRDHYRLEDIWGEVAIPLADVVGPFRKKAPAKKPATKKAAPKNPSAREPSTAKPTT